MLLQLGAGPLALYGIYRVGLSTGHYRRLDASLKADAARAESKARPLFELPAAAALRASLSPRAMTALIKQANEAMLGKVRLFGAHRAALDLG